MSLNRTRWLDKLRPAGASSGGWTEGPMARVETTDAATVDQRCSFKHRTGWRHDHSNSILCVALRMGQGNLCELSSLRRGHALFTSILQAFVRVILEQGSMSSSKEKKRPELQANCIVNSDLDCHVQGPCSNIQIVIFAQGSCSLRHTTRFTRVILE